VTGGGEFFHEVRRSVPQSVLQSVPLPQINGMTSLKPSIRKSWLITRLVLRVEPNEILNFMALPILSKDIKKTVTDFINSQKIVCYVMHTPPGIARFMKEKLGKELGKIEADLRDEQVKIEIGSAKLECTGTKGRNT
jgi:hypothetical protein